MVSSLILCCGLQGATRRMLADPALQHVLEMHQMPAGFRRALETLDTSQSQQQQTQQVVPSAMSDQPFLPIVKSCCMQQHCMLEQCKSREQCGLNLGMTLRNADGHKSSCRRSACLVRQTDTWELGGC